MHGVNSVVPHAILTTTEASAEMSYYAANCTIDRSVSYFIVSLPSHTVCENHYIV